MKKEALKPQGVIRKSQIISFILALIFAFSFLTDFSCAIVGSAQSEDEKAETIRIGTYNIASISSDDKLQALATFISQNKIEAIGMQEVKVYSNNNVIKKLADFLGWNYSTNSRFFAAMYNQDASDGKGTYDYGVAILCKYPIKSNSEPIYIPSKNQERVFGRVTFETPKGTSVNLYTAHLDTTWNSNNFHTYNENHEALKIIASEMEKTSGIVTGDFNYSPAFLQQDLTPDKFVYAVPPDFMIKTLEGYDTTEPSVDNIVANASHYSIVSATSVDADISDHFGVFADVMITPTVFGARKEFEKGATVQITNTVGNLNYSLADLGAKASFVRTKASENSQKWFLERSLNNMYVLKNSETGKYLCIKDGKLFVSDLSSATKVYFHEIDGKYAIKVVESPSDHVISVNDVTQKYVGSSSQLFSVRVLSTQTDDSLNKQFAIPDGNGGYKNMTDLNEMKSGETVYALIINDYEEYNSSGSVTYSKDALTFKGENNAVLCEPMSYGYAYTQFQQRIWKITKDSWGYFKFSPLGYDNLSLAVGPQKGYGSYPWEYTKLLTAKETGAAGQRWKIEKADLSVNSALENAYYIMPRGKDGYFVNRQVSQYTWSDGGVWEKGTAQLYHGSKTVDTPKSRWLILPLIQNNEKDVTYGYVGAPSYVSSAERTFVPNQFYTTTISSLMSGDYYGAKLTYTMGKNSEQTEYFQKTVEGLGESASSNQLFDLVSNNNAAFLWQYNFGGTSESLTVKDDDAWETQLLEYEQVKDNSNGAKYNSHKFWTAYSLNKDGGYYITPAAYKYYADGNGNYLSADGSYANGYNNAPYSFRVLSLRQESRMCTRTLKLAATDSQRFRIPISYGTPIEGTAEALSLLDSSSYTEKDGALLGIKNKTTSNDLVLNFENENISVFDISNNVLPKDAICGTGCSSGFENGERLTLIIKGDVDGDGEITSTDYLKIKSFFLGILNIENEFFLAADVDDDGEIRSTDYLRIKSHFLGAADLYN